jgi:hypothetical protein
MVKGGLTEKRKKEDSLWEKLSRKEIRGSDSKFRGQIDGGKRGGFGGEQEELGGK